MRNLSQEEAKKIELLARFTLEDVIWRSEGSLLESEGITFEFLQEMRDLGIISGAAEIDDHVFGWVTDAPDKFVTELRSNSKVLVVNHEDPEKVITLGKVYLLTAMGRLILQLGEFETHSEYLRQIVSAIQNQGFG